MKLLRPCLALLALLAACAQPPRSELPRTADAPSPHIAATANTLATRAALQVLERGGSAIDAAVAAQAVGGLVEPQASGIGGGALVIHWDAKTRKLASFDGLAAAPARVTAGLRTDVDGRLLDVEPSQRGGRTVGIPGVLAALQLAHSRYGRLPWADLFAPAIDLAEQGFPMPQYLHEALDLVPRALRSELSAYYAADGMVPPPGSLVRNPEYAKTLRRVARDGPRGLWSEGGAARFVAAAQRGFKPSLITERDLAEYQPVERDTICNRFTRYRVCTMAPPSYGGIVVLQVLQMVEARAGGRYDFGDPGFVHLFAEAGKLAQADRRRYVGDPDQVDVPLHWITASAYAVTRAAQIDPGRANKSPQPGTAPQPVAMTSDTGEATAMTSQIAIADRDGNVVAMTTTVNLVFGAQLMVDGYILNNALTNFAPAPGPRQTIANAMAPRKRPVTSMAPTIVFDESGSPFIVGGSAGGGPIVDYVSQSLIEMIANGLAPLQALAKPHVTSAVPGKLQLEQDTSITALAPALRERGHEVEEVRLRSGLAFIKRDRGGWVGAADPRRDGSAQ